MAQASPSGSPVNGPLVNRSGKPDWVLSYIPAADNGPGCVQGGYGIQASYEPAWFQLQRHNTSGQLQERVMVTSGPQGGRLRLYRIEAGKEVFVEDLIAAPSPSTSQSDVQPGGLLDFVNFSWPNEPQTPAGDYVARMVSPAVGTEIRFTLTRDGKRP